jgi:hypothetical protein
MSAWGEAGATSVLASGSDQCRTVAASRLAPKADIPLPALPTISDCLVKLFHQTINPRKIPPVFVFVRHALIYITDKQGRQTCRSELVVQAETGNARAEFRTRGHCVGDCSAREIGGQSGGYAAEVHIKVFTFHRPVWVEGPLAAAANRVAGHRLAATGSARQVRQAAENHRCAIVADIVPDFETGHCQTTSRVNQKLRLDEPADTRPGREKPIVSTLVVAAKDCPLPAGMSPPPARLLFNRNDSISSSTP